MKRFSHQIVSEINNLLSDSKKIVIIGHNNPDGDATGSALSLFHVFQKTKHDVKVIMPSKLSDFLLWMPKQEEVIIFNEEKELASKLLEDAEIIFCVDFNNSGRTERVKTNLEDAKAIKIMIDHHPNPQSDAQYIFSDTAVSSASELVYEFIQATSLSENFNKDAAICIFTGIMTDTLNFSVNSSRQETFKIVGELLAYGIDKEYIYDKVYNNFSINRLKLVGYLLYEKMQIIEEYNFALIVLTKEEMKKFNYKNGDNEGIVNMPLSVAEIDVSIIAVEKDNFVKLSLRSKGEVDVNLLARKYFNGGGHRNAAGGRIYKPVDKVIDLIKGNVEDFFSK